MTADAGAPAPTRRARRKAQTRASLIEAARLLFAQQSVESTTINEITDKADVGFGSFYNHFESKDAIALAVVEGVAREIGESVDRAASEVEDPAEVVAIAHRAVILRAVDDPNLGWLMVRLELSHDVVFAALGPYAARDLERGVRAGRFVVDDPAAALVASGGALLAVVRAILQGRLGRDAAIVHAAGVLRMLGVSADEAAEVASRRLPPL